MCTCEAKYSAKAVANSLIEKCEEMSISDVTPMKLQKLLYFAQAWHLAFLDAPLFKEDIQAWEWGPVIPEIYSEFRSYGNQPIDRKALELRWVDGEMIVDYPKMDSTDEDANEILQNVLNVYGRLSAIQLSNITHAKETPWSIVASNYPSYLPRGLQIPNELIRDVFKKMSEDGAANVQQI